MMVNFVTILLGVKNKCMTVILKRMKMLWVRNIGVRTYDMTVSNDLSAHTSTDDHITQIDSSGKS